jgi:hypothetical protein
VPTRGHFFGRFRFAAQYGSQKWKISNCNAARKARKARKKLILLITGSFQKIKKKPKKKPF